MMAKARRLGCLCTVGILTLSSVALAGEQDVILLPTATASSGSQELTLPQGETELAQMAQQLDALAQGTVQDLGFQVQAALERPLDASRLTETALVSQAQESWVISPRLLETPRGVALRLVAVPPGQEVLLVKTEVLESEFDVQAMHALKNLLEARRPGAQIAPSPPPPAAPDRDAVVYHARSQGRAVLALSSAALGGFMGLSLQRASGSDDARLTYPLIALGTGLGLGGSMIVADEWDVGSGDAWFVTAGFLWPTTAGMLLSTGFDADTDDRYIYGLAGAGVGLGLALVPLSMNKMSDAGAAITHSGGAFGLGLGGLTELLVRGSTEETPKLGMGFGTAVGVLTGGVLATQLEARTSQVLFIDLAAGLGALTGAALASPVLFVEDGSTESRDRIWLGSIVTGTLGGGIVGYFLTNSSSASPSSSSGLRFSASGPVALDGPSVGASVTGEF